MSRWRDSPRWKTTTSSTGPDPTETILAQRYLAAELLPSFALRKDVSLGVYYLGSRGLDPGTTRTTHFVTVNATLDRLSLTDDLYLRLAPQVYYLRMDGVSGYYATATASLSSRRYPLSLPSILNQALQTEIVARGEFVWNVSLIYSYRRTYEGR
jgi:hypothetical protein